MSNTPQREGYACHVYILLNYFLHTHGTGAHAIHAHTYIATDTRPINASAANCQCQHHSVHAVAALPSNIG